MSYLLKLSQTAQPLVFLLIDASDHISGLPGAAPTVTLSKNGGAFAAASGAVTEISGGWYAVAGSADDTDTLGPLLLHAEAAGADPVDDRYDVVAFDPQIVIPDVIPSADIAAAILSLDVAVVEAIMAEHSLGTVILSLLQSHPTTTNWRIMRTDGETVHLTRPIPPTARAVSLPETD